MHRPPEPFPKAADATENRILGAAHPPPPRAPRSCPLGPPCCTRRLPHVCPLSPCSLQRPLGCRTRVWFPSLGGPRHCLHLARDVKFRAPSCSKRHGPRCGQPEGSWAGLDIAVNLFQSFSSKYPVAVARVDGIWIIAESPLKSLDTVTTETHVPNLLTTPTRTRSVCKLGS